MFYLKWKLICIKGVKLLTYMAVNVRKLAYFLYSLRIITYLTNYFLLISKEKIGIVKSDIELNKKV